MKNRYKGKLKACDAEKGYGFIKLPGFSKDVFVHKSHMPEKKPPVNDQKIEFSIEETEKGPQAREIEVLFTPSKRDTRSNPNRRHARPQAANRTSSGNRAPHSSKPATPYTFVPVQVEKSEEDGYTYPTASLFDVPGHDGSKIDGRISGKLKLTLTAHTPLLVGGRHFKIPGQERTVIEPWRLKDEHGRVVLAGSSLKGMIRHYLSALLNAPMEKVYEQYFSYRPNLDFPNRNARLRLQVREAVIDKAPDESGKGMKIRVLDQGRQAIFIRGQALKIITRSSKNGRLAKGAEIRGISRDGQRIHSASSSSWIADKEYQILEYHGGIAGIVDSESLGTFSKLHDAGKEQNGRHRETLLYKCVLAPINGKPTEVEPHIVSAYQKTQQELADRKHGHSSSRNPNIGKDDKKARWAASSLKEAKLLKLLKPNTLIYVEVDDAGDVVSFGHHFRYRWGYRDTVRKLNRIDNEPHTRPELSMHYEEGAGITETGFSASLTAARAIFGYIADEGLHGGVFSGSFQRLAGRVSMNHAVEVIEHGRTGAKDRFVHKSGSALLPLKELGSPKASAVEFYVQQDRGENKAGRLSTYGDLVEHPETAADHREESFLAGRKFYRHQPVDPESGKPYLAQTKEEMENSRAPLVHCVSNTKTNFCFTLSFQDLDEVELGALLFLLGIQHADQFKADQFKEEAAPLRDGVEIPKYALKVGYARPLGFGSVTFSLDAVEEITYEKTAGRTKVTLESIDDPNQWRQTFVQAFLDKVHEEPGLAPHLDICLAAWAYAGRQEAAYPRKGEHVYNFHTDLRRRHSKARRIDGNAESLLEETALVQPGYGKKASSS